MVDTTPLDHFPGPTRASAVGSMSIATPHPAWASAAAPADPDSPPAPAPSRALAAIRRFGTNTTSHQGTGPEFLPWFFRSPDVEGDEVLVCYVDTGEAWVAAGDPVGPAYLIGQAARAFVRAANERDRRAAFVASEVELDGLRAEALGLSAEWDPREWSETKKRSSKLREQIRRARAKGVTARFVTDDERAGPELERLAGAWLSTRRAPPLSFFCAIDVAALTRDQEIVVAEREGRWVAAAVLTPIFGRRGVLLEHLLRAPDAPNGTAELVFDFVLADMSARDRRVLSLGTAPLSGECSPLFRAVRRVARPFYDFDGLFAFKRRLHPTSFRTTYLRFPSEQGLVTTAWDVLSAFTWGQPARFALRTLARRVFGDGPRRRGRA